MSGARRLAPVTSNRLSAIFSETGRYLLVSAAALALDYGLLIVLTEFLHLNYLVSAGFGFVAGLSLNYVLSTTFVFRERSLASRWMEAAGFVLIGIAGLALNEGLMKLFVEFGGLHYAIAKIPATGVGFIFNFGTRRLLLFTKRKSATGSEIEPQAIAIYPVSSRPQLSG